MGGRKRPNPRRTVNTRMPHAPTSDHTPVLKLNKCIAEGMRALRDPEVPENTNLQKWVWENLDLLDVASEVLELKLKEKKLLAEHGVDYRPYQTYDLS